MGGHGPWSPFTLVNAQVVLVVVLIIDGLACVVGDDGAQASMYTDGGGGQSSFAGGCGEHFAWLVGVGGSWVIFRGWCVWSVVAIVVPCVRMVGSCRLCGWLGPFWVVVGSRRLREV